MNKEFTGPFKEYLEEYVQYRTNSGYDFVSTISKLHTFDKYTKNINLTKLNLDLFYNYINRYEKASTRQAIASSLRGLTDYLYNREIIDFTIPIKLYTRGKRHEPYILTDSEINIFFRTLKLMYLEFDFKHDLLILYFTLLYCTGLRARECCEIKIEDINFIDKVIKLNKTKNNHERYIAINDKIMDLIINIQNKYEKYYKTNQYIFVKYDLTKYKAGDMYAIFKRIIYQAKIKNLQGKTPRMHDLRFTFCIKSYIQLSENDEIGKFLPVLSAYMGHRDYKSTEYYLSLVSKMYPSIKKKAEDYTAFVIRKICDFDE